MPATDLLDRLTRILDSHETTATDTGTALGAMTPTANGRQYVQITYGELRTLAAELMDTPAEEPGGARRFALGADYRNSQLGPGVIVVRQVSHGPQTLVSGTPCCLRTVQVPHADLEYQRTQKAAGRPHGGGVDRRCPECGWQWRLLADDVTAPALMRVIEWESAEQ